MHVCWTFFTRILQVVILIGGMRPTAGATQQQQQRQASFIAPNSSHSSAASPPGAPVPQLPRVMLVDLDGTLVGKVNAAVCEYDILRKSAAVQGGSNAAHAKAVRAFKESLVARLRYGIVRPHVEAFIKQAQRMNPPVEIFIYTASDPQWAAVIIPAVEAALGVKFNRPLFTRQHCISAPPHMAAVGGPMTIRKSIAHVLPAIYTRLKKKYSLRSINDLRGNIAIVDNTHDILADPTERSRLIRCPTYEYTYLYDVLCNVDVNTLHRRFSRLIPVLSGFGMFPGKVPADTIRSYHQFAGEYYARLANAINDSLTNNARYLSTDRFWAHLLYNMASPRASTLNDDAVSFLNRRCNPQINNHEIRDITTIRDSQGRQKRPLAHLPRDSLKSPR